MIVPPKHYVHEIRQAVKQRDWQSADTLAAEGIQRWPDDAAMQRTFLDLIESMRLEGDRLGVDMSQVFGVAPGPGDRIRSPRSREWCSCPNGLDVPRPLGLRTGCDH